MTKLQEQYKQETGNDPIYYDDDDWHYITDEYMEWFEARDEAREQEIERLKERLEALEQPCPQNSSCIHWKTYSFADTNKFGGCSFRSYCRRGKGDLFNVEINIGD